MMIQVRAGVLVRSEQRQQNGGRGCALAMNGVVMEE
jgi:hypothetical protein